MIVSIASFVLLLQGGAVEQPRTTRLAGRDVAIRAPVALSAIPPDFPHAEAGAWKFAFRPDGSLWRRYRKDGAAEDFALAAVPAAEAPAWRVRAFVETRTEVLERSRDGLYRMRRATLEPSQVTASLEALAAFAVRAEAAAEGRIRVLIDATIEDDPIRERVTGPRTLFGADFLRERYATRINGHPFDADDKVYRGPFDSVFVIHPGYARPAQTMIAGTPVTALSYYGRTFPPYELQTALFEAWTGQVLAMAAAKGYPLALSERGRGITALPTLGNGAGHESSGELPRSSGELPASSGEMRVEDFVTPAMWAALTAKGEPDAEYVRRAWAKPGAGPFSWEAVRDEPWIMLPRIAAGEGLAVPLWAAEALNAKIPGAIAGWTEVDGRPMIVFRTTSRTAAEAFGVTPPAALPSPNRPGTFGRFTVTKVADVEKGNVVEVTESGAFREGMALVTDEPLGDATSATFLEFWIKTTSEEPYALWTPEGLYFEINPFHPQPAEDADVPAPPAVHVKTDGAWQKVVVDLRKVAPGLKSLAGIRLMPTRRALAYERQKLEPSKVLLTGFALRPSDPGDASPSAGPAPRPPAEQRAMQAAKATEADKAILLELIKDQQELVRLNAAAALTAIQLPEAVPALIDQARSANPMIAELALEALAFQGTNEAWGAILTICVKGPFDHNRQFAARLLGTKGEMISAGSISTLMTCRSPRAREEAARALGKIPDKDAGIILMALLMEVDPNVRLAVIEGANVQLELVNRRLLWSAVNDPSELVRAASYRRLIESPIADYRSEALKGVRDESPWIRLALLDAMRAKPDAAYRQSQRLAVTDSRAAVRAAALQAFAAMPGQVESAEIENVFVDKDPRVQMALVQLARAKSIRLPESALANLRNSISSDVVKQAQELGF